MTNNLTKTSDRSWRLPKALHSPVGNWLNNLPQHSFNFLIYSLEVPKAPELVQHGVNPASISINHTWGLSNWLKVGKLPPLSTS